MAQRRCAAPSAPSISRRLRFHTGAAFRRKGFASSARDRRGRRRHQSSAGRWSTHARLRGSTRAIAHHGLPIMRKEPATMFDDRSQASTSITRTACSAALRVSSWPIRERLWNSRKRSSPNGAGYRAHDGAPRLIRRACSRAAPPCTIGEQCGRTAGERAGWQLRAR